MMLSIAAKFQYVNSLFIFFLTHYTFRPLQAIFRCDIQLDILMDYFQYNGSVARTQFDVYVEMLYAVHRYLDFVFLIHVISWT
jgi:hypothetical protein